MSPVEKATILAQVEQQSRGKRQKLMVLGVPKSSYYRWRHGQSDSGNRRRPWNRITPCEEDKILAVARESPDLSSRQLSAWITDNEGFAVSESTVYRILRREGLVKRQETQLMAANSRVREDNVFGEFASHKTGYRESCFGLVKSIDNQRAVLLT